MKEELASLERKIERIDSDNLYQAIANIKEVMFIIHVLLVKLAPKDTFNE